MMSSQLLRNGIKQVQSTVLCRQCFLQSALCWRTSTTRLQRFVSRKPFSTSRIRFSKSDVKSEVKGKTNNATSKAIPKFSEVKKLFILAHPERWKLAGAVGLLLISSSVGLAIPFCMGKVIDLINTASREGNLMEQLNYIASVLAVVFVVGGLANFGRVYLMTISGSRVVMKMREQLFGSIMRQEIGFFDKTKTGELINRLSTDTSLVGQSVTMNISDGLRAVAQAVGSIGMMVYVSPSLTAVVLCIVPPVAVMSRIYGRYMRRLTKDVQDSLAGATEVAEERISNIRTVRAFAQEDRECAVYNKSISHILMLSYKEALARGVFFGSTGMSGNFVVLAVFYAGGIMMSDSLLTIGELSAFLMYAAYIGVSIGGLTSFYTELMRGLGASTRIFELTDRQPLVPYKGGSIPNSPVLGNIEFRDIDFVYPSRNDAVIFSRLNLTVPSGSVTAVVGSSGSGKSTLTSLLLRLYDPSTGGVYLDNQNIKDLDPNWLRSQIGTVSQEPVLFSCSIADNIKYGASDPSLVTTSMIEEASRQANAYNFITSFPEGFNTLVGERGLMLSGGQRQRIALARAILKDPKILLLDEATSALDAESEHLVKEAIDRLMVGRTVISIAHRLSTIQTAEQIAVLDNGRVAELGSYQELMNVNEGIFKKLVERQTITT